MEIVRISKVRAYWQLEHFTLNEARTNEPNEFSECGIRSIRANATEQQPTLRAKPIYRQATDTVLRILFCSTSGIDWRIYSFGLFGENV